MVVGLVERRGTKNAGVARLPAERLHRAEDMVGLLVKGERKKRTGGPERVRRNGQADRERKKIKLV